MTTAETIATGLELLGTVGAGAPGVGPWIAVLAKLGATIARAGGTPDHVTAIDGEAIVRRRAEADARLDHRAETRDYRVEARHAVPDAPDTEPNIYDEAPVSHDPNDDERSELGPERVR